jgi:hypothetical protein
MYLNYQSVIVDIFIITLFCMYFLHLAALNQCLAYVSLIK